MTSERFTKVFTRNSLRNRGDKSLPPRQDDSNEMVLGKGLWSMEAGDNKLECGSVRPEKIK